MAIEIPAYLDPIIQLYNIPWPDIDEDAFHNVQQPLRDFGQDLDAVGESIESAIGILTAANPSSTLQSVLAHAQFIRSTYLDPIKGICDDLAGAPCEIAFDMTCAMKWSLLALLSGEIANDLLDAAATVVTFGADAVLTGAEALAVREAVSESASIAESEIINAVMSAANQCIDNFVSSLINPFINEMVHGVEGAANSYLPRFLLQQELGMVHGGVAAEGGLAGRLHLSPAELENCVQSIVQSSAHLATAEQSLSSAIDDIFSHPAPNAPSAPESTVMRMALKGVVHTIRQDLVDGVKSLVKDVIQHFETLLRDFMNAIDDLDKQASALASKQHALPVPLVEAISAAGVGFAAAADVAAASGRINSDEALAVKMEEVTVEEDGRSLAIHAESVVVLADGATTTVSVEDVHRPPPAPTVTAGVASASHGNVDNLQTKVTAEGTHGGQGAQGAVTGTSAPDPLDIHRAGEHRPHVEATATQPHSGPEHLDHKRPDGRGPKSARAESSAHEVQELRKDEKVDLKPAIDSSPANGDSVDQ